MEGGSRGGSLLNMKASDGFDYDLVIIGDDHDAALHAVGKNSQKSSPKLQISRLSETGLNGEVGRT